MFLRKGMSVEYLIPGVVVKYIQRHGLCESQTAARQRSVESTKD